MFFIRNFIKNLEEKIVMKNDTLKLREELHSRWFYHRAIIDDFDQLRTEYNYLSKLIK